MSSSLYDACAWFSTGLGDHHSHDAQIAFFPVGTTTTSGQSCLNVDTAQYFDDASTRLAPDAESMIVLANPVLPHSEGEIVLESADPADHPAIRMNYFGDPHDMKVMVAVMRRALEIVAHWPAHRKIGPLMVPPFLAQKHGYREGATPSDALLEDLALHFSLTVYHLTMHLPDRQRRRSATPGDGGREAARGGRERHAERGQRQHERGVDHDRRKGGGDDRRRPRREARGVRGRASRQPRLIFGPG